MDEKVTRQRIRRAVDPGEGFPDAGLLERTMNRLQESDRGHPRPWPWLVAVAVAVLTAGAVGTLMVSRLPHSAGPLQVAPGASGRVPTIALPSTRSGVVEDFQFASATSGWLLEYGADGHSHVLQTTDGGAHWAQVGDLAGLRPYATSLDFISDQGSVIVGPPQTGADISAAAAAGARVYSTGDGGAHWRVADVPAAMDFLRSASFVSPDEGWVVVGPAHGGSVSVYHTTDAGQSWQLVASSATTPLLAGLTSKAQVKFTGPQDGWISTFIQNPSAELLLATRDGGRTWRSVALPAPPGVDMRGRRVTGGMPTLFGSQGFLVAGLYRPQPQPSGLPPDAGVGVPIDALYVYSTQDGGLHWSFVRALTKLGLAFTDMTHWVAMGPDGVSSSADAGRTWSAPRQIPAPPGWGPIRPTFVGSSGWAVLAPDSKGVGATDSAGKLPRFAVIGTTDGGAHWVDQQLPPQ